MGLGRERAIELERVHGRYPHETRRSRKHGRTASVGAERLLRFVGPQGVRNCRLLLLRLAKVGTDSAVRISNRRCDLAARHTLGMKSANLGLSD